MHIASQTEFIVISIEHVNKSYRSGGQSVQALTDVSLQVAQGEIFGVIGRSGAGKSSLIRCLNLLERPDSGQVLVDGIDLTALPPRELPEHRRRIGMIFQHFNLLHSKTVAQNVAFPLRLAGERRTAVIRERVDELLALVGLAGLGDRYPHQLSGGQKQRVGIARALANRPTVLLSDEATSALDPQTTQSILALLADINQQLGLTIVLITHEMSVIRQLCDRVAVLDHGHIVESGTVSEVFLHPRHAVTQSLLGELGLVDESALQRLRQETRGPLIRLTFVGEATHQPVLSRVTQQTGLHFNILQGSVGHIKTTPYGQLLVEAVGEVPDLSRVLRQFEQWQIHHEVLA
ncbi:MULTISPECIES: methionine ABC transporter ATP-binding protein [unclassified Paludibacterium]|uniref:methionine ABC transporter ATP-binding protein n=1 Tax=unclassified Paludibacterium TaxID=2618429 RepID=UPI00273A25B2|nr:ATP-binding cassette domain-containing protein [Paludibacterium sp. B53371]BEV70778.1 methionine ABC transporter ATP-binding protein [Paludibacterium sp. THUN1379]